jgi:hypothetical protein
VRPGASVLYVRATRASLLRAVRTGGTKQLACEAPRTVRDQQPPACRTQQQVERARVFGITRINVTAISPLELLGRYYAHVPVLDYASVDVEGAELTIMNAWPFERWCVN